MESKAPVKDGHADQPPTAASGNESIPLTVRPSMASIAETETATADVSGAQTPLLASSASVATKPSFATLGAGNDSATDLLRASAPFARAASIVSKPSLASLPETTGFSRPGTQHHQPRNLTLKASLASLPESPRSPTGATLSPIASASPRSTDELTKGPAQEQDGDGIPPGLLNNPDAPPPKQMKYKKTLQNFIRIFSYTTRVDRILMCASVISALGAGLTFPLMTIVIGQLIGSFASVTASWSDVNYQNELTDIINQTVLYMVYLFTGRFILGYIATLGFRMTSLRVASSMRLAYLRALLFQRVSLLDTHMPPGRIAAIMTTTANTLQLGISEKLTVILQALSLMVSATVISFIHSWRLALVTSSGLVLITICYCVTIPFVVRNMREVEETNIKASAIASETIGSMRMVAACGAETRMSARYGKWVAEFQRKGMRLSRIVAAQQSAVHFSIYATFALSFWFAVKMLLQSEIPNVGALVVILMCVMMIVMAVSGLAAPISAAARAAGAASILFMGIDAPKPIVTGLKGAAEVNVEGNLALWNVNFTYPTRPKLKVLDGLNLIIPAGKVTAIVGPSGSGKSTIVGLIERWYELDGARENNVNNLILFFRNGTITCGGKRLHEIDLKWWRSQIGLVQQEPFLFNDTIFNNVANGLIGTQWEDASTEKKRELVEQACKEAFADEFISRLPEGYDTPVGDSGNKLSGGQRQRLAIARSIVKQPKILILDEATSSLDVRGEKVVQAALDKVSKNRTTIMIAHRLSTVKKADNIVVLSKGKVVQWGTHDSLIAQEGSPYWLLTNAQQLVMGEEGPRDEVPEITEEEKRTMDILTLDESKAEPTDASSTTTEIPPKAKGMLRSFGSMLLEQQKTLWPWYSIMFAGVLIAGACTPVQAYLFASLLSSFAFWGNYLIDMTNFWCLMFTMLAIASGLGYFALGFAATRVSFRITGAYRVEYFKNIVSKPISFFDKEEHSVGALTGVIATDPAQLQQMLGTNMAFVTISVLSVTGCLILAFYFGWKLTLVALSSSMPLTLAAGFFRIRAEKGFEKMNLVVFAESAKFATESIGAIRTVTSLTMEDSICRRYENLLQEHVQKAFRRARYATLIFSASDSLPLLCMAFVLWYGGRLLVSGEYQTLNYLVVYIAVIQGAMSAGQWLSFGPNIAQATIAANRIQAMRQQEADETQGMPLAYDDHKLDEKGVKIELQDVWFKYPTRDVPVLCGLNMTIEKGQFAAIVGPSGCGKTSIISLLERFYKVRSGAIKFNGNGIQNLNLIDYRRAISLVAQEPSLFEGTIRENILIGVQQDSDSSDEVLHQACRDAEIHDFITSLPDGYNTLVGIKGVLLSGGQKQRIAIARALIRNPRLLLLDEATSNLDSETEKQIQRVFERTRRTRTMVVVAHRLATIQNADVIFVLGDGRVLETGTHASLLQGKGVYFSMCQAQALDR